MSRALLLLAAGLGVGAGGMSLAQHDKHGKGSVKTLSRRDITEKLDGKKAKATAVEGTLAPGEGEAPHRHPGPAVGYGLEGADGGAGGGDKPKVPKGRGT